MNRTIHSMKLKPEPFAQIKSGLKTIELRLFDEKRRLINVDDTIVFTNTDDGEVLKTTVIALHLFDSFDKLYETLPLTKCGYTEQTISQASPSDMNQYYSQDEQAKYGVLGIELYVVH